jgi:hypothetical protein
MPVRFASHSPRHIFTPTAEAPAQLSPAANTPGRWQPGQLSASWLADIFIGQAIFTLRREFRSWLAS